MKEKQEYYRDKLERLERNNEKKFEIEKEIFDRTLIEKESKIEKLEKEVAYLSTLLSYWKPVDEANKEAADHIMSKQGNEKEENGSMVHSTTLKVDMKNSSVGGNMVQLRDRRGSAALQNSDLKGQINNEIANLSKVSQIKQEEPKKRQKQTAEKRHSEEAEKKRKVAQGEVQDLGELLKYRFIGQGMSIAEVKDCFSYKPAKEDGFILNGEDQD